MRAWQITEPGGPEQLQLTERPNPDPGPGEVRVAVRAVGVNRADVLQRRGMYPPPPGTDPSIPGLEYAGVVDAVGAGVVDRTVGEAVMGLVPGEAYAEMIRVPAAETLSIPEGLDWASAAAVPEAFLTAWRALVPVGHGRAGEIVVVRPATSAVGMAALQVARWMGARPVAMGRSAERLARLDDRWVDARISADEDSKARLNERFGRGADLAIDMVAGKALGALLSGLEREGRVVLLGLLGGPKADVSLAGVLFKALSVRGMTMRSLRRGERESLAADFHRQLAPAFDAGALAPLVSHRVPFDEAPEAHRVMEAGEAFGKIVLTL